MLLNFPELSAYVSLETLTIYSLLRYRRLIPKSTFMHFLAILTFLHIWKDKSQGYLKMQAS